MTIVGEVVATLYAHAFSWEDEAATQRGKSARYVGTRAEAERLALADRAQKKAAIYRSLALNLERVGGGE